jgi:predicted nuclease with TOPRIM domain
MGDSAESAVARLWRDRMQAREQERNEAQRRARVAEANVAALTAENDRLASQNARLNSQSTRLAIEVARLSAQNERLAADIAWLRAQLAPAPARDETEQQMEALRTELLSLLNQSSGSSLH